MARWGTRLAGRSRSTTARQPRSNLTYCQQCHADNAFGGPGSNPRFNVQLGRLVDAALGNTGCEVCHAPLGGPSPGASDSRCIRRHNPDYSPRYSVVSPLQGQPLRLRCLQPLPRREPGWCRGSDGRHGLHVLPQSGLPTTLKNCASCHGAPPSGTVYPNIALAHPSHATLNVADICGECHNGLGSVTLDHFLRARNHTTSVQTGAVVFGAFAQTGGVSPVYNETTLQCTNTYCHGATLVGGANKSPVWSDANYLTAAGCGTCHGFPPANAAHTGFTSSTACKTCHPHVNATNTGFDDPTKHVNGVIDVAGGGPCLPVSRLCPFIGSRDGALLRLRHQRLPCERQRH